MQKLTEAQKKQANKKRFGFQVIGGLFVAFAAIIPWDEPTAEAAVLSMYFGCIIFFIGFISSDEFLISLNEKDDDIF